MLILPGKIKLLMNFDIDKRCISFNNVFIQGKGAACMILNRLFELQDIKYRNFQSKLIPTVDQSLVIGVRTPVLRKFAKGIAGTAPAEEFLKNLPHKYYDENNLHAFLIETILDFDACIAALDAFLPYVDNWATCDMLSPKVFGKNVPKLLPHIRRWMTSDHVYTARYSVVMLMKHCMHEWFCPEHPEWVCAMPSGDYYLKMVRAWYFATALTVQRDTALPYILERRLDRWTHNKAIQKAVESNCISDEFKAELRRYRWK